MKKHHIFAILAVPFLLAGCAPYDVGFGDTVKQNIALQVIDPDPQYKGAVQPGSSGDHAAQAVERYREGKVIKPATTLTTTKSTSGAGSQGAGAGSSSQ